MKRQYEAMFLFDSGFAGDFKNVEDEVRRLMDRAEAEIVVCRKWDERRLAYEVNGRKRGVYVLVYFLAETEKLAGIERDVQISDPVLRVLIVRADEVTRERMEDFLPPERKPEPAPPVTEAKADTAKEKPADGPAKPAADAVVEEASPADVNASG